MVKISFSGGILLDWIIQNKEWLFSGIGVVVLTTIVTLVTRSNTRKQTQKVGDNSTAIQVGKDLKIGNLDEKK